MVNLSFYTKVIQSLACFLQSTLMNLTGLVGVQNVVSGLKITDLVFYSTLENAIS